MFYPSFSPNHHSTISQIKLTQGVRSIINLLEVTL